MQTICILQVDDHEGWRGILSKHLAAMGYVVSSHAVLQEAKHHYASGSFDLVITDGNVDASEDGIRWAEELFDNGQPVIIISSIEHPEITCMQKAHYDKQKLNLLIEELLA